MPISTTSQNSSPERSSALPRGFKKCSDAPPQWRRQRLHVAGDGCWQVPSFYGCVADHLTRRKTISSIPTAVREKWPALEPWRFNVHMWPLLAAMFADAQDTLKLCQSGW